MSEEKKGWLDFLKIGKADREEAASETGDIGVPGKFAREFLQGLLDQMGLFTVVKVTESSESGARLEIKSDEVGLVIGKEGNTLNAVQYLTNVATNRRCGQRVSIVVEAGDYRQKQEERIQAMAMEAANKTHRTGKRLLLDPMTAYERRLVHLTLKEDPRVHTASIGEGSARRVMIIPGPEPTGPTPDEPPSTA